MKILFICGSLEPGKDGVGDYTRRLGGELSRMGNQVSIIALNDRHLHDVYSGLQQADRTEIPVLRLSYLWLAKKRYQKAEGWIAAFQPDWVSLQFVPFSFHPKGLPFGLAKHLKRIAGKAKIHIMFHELWVGAYGQKTLKKATLGYIQRFVISTLLHRLKPNVITTSNLVYQKKLYRNKATLLPLFGNIPIAQQVLRFHSDTDILNVVHFGTFTHHISDFQYQLKAIQQLAAYNKKPIRFTLLGNAGAHKEKYTSLLKQVLGVEAIEELGKLPSEEISQYLLNADIGLSRADYSLYGKSGSTLAMIEHGLPVLLRGKRPDQFYRSKLSSLQELLFFTEDIPYHVPGKKQPVSLLEEVSLLYYNLLNNEYKPVFSYQ